MEHEYVIVLFFANMHIKLYMKNDLPEKIYIQISQRKNVAFNLYILPKSLIKNSLHHQYHLNDEPKAFFRNGFVDSQAIRFASLSEWIGFNPVSASAGSRKPAIKLFLCINLPVRSGSFVWDDISARPLSPLCRWQMPFDPHHICRIHVYAMDLVEILCTEVELSKNQRKSLEICQKITRKLCQNVLFLLYKMYKLFWNIKVRKSNFENKTSFKFVMKLDLVKIEYF